MSPELFVREAPTRAVARALGAVALLAVAFVGVLRLAVSGLAPTVVVAVLAPGVLLALVAAVFRAGVVLGPLATDERGEARPLRRRHGFAVVAVATVLSLPMLGAFSLVDPWETHYAEVAREMIERRDFVSPWWANEGFFMSKPVLTFWLEAAAMKLFGVGTGPDAVIASSSGRLLHPEWAVRFPAFALALLGAYLLYHGVSRTCGRRAGLFAGIALVTMPGYALLSRQAITDMPLVACTGASLGLLLRAFDTHDAVIARGYALRFGPRRVTLHAGHAVALLVVLLVLPQILVFLLAHARDGGALGPARLFAGSPHACGLPGQPACALLKLAHPWLAPVLIASFVLPVLVYAAATIAEERRIARLFAIGAWIFASLAAMAKGPAGLVVPAAAALVVVFAKRDVKGSLDVSSLAALARRLLRLEIVRGLLVAVLLVAPWYVAVYGRNGRGYLDELVLRHMFGRTLGHLHDTNAGEDVGVTYFVKQLAWATFPWSGLLAAAFAALPLRRERARRDHARLLVAAASIVAFALVSLMRTKFHHYVLLALPPCAAVLGIWLDERLAERADPARVTQARRLHTTALFALAAVVSALVLHDLATDGHARRFLQLLTYRYDRQWISAAATTTLLGVAGAGAVAAGVVLVVRRRGVVSWAPFAAATIFTVVLLDITLARGAKDGGQRDVLDAYYQLAGPRPARPLVAYQLNWKGENFYTGNHLAIFVSSGAPMKKWIDAERARTDRGKTFYFVLERGRVGTLRSELGAPIEVITDPSVSAEFALVRAEL